jgi:hypothetical protein
MRPERNSKIVLSTIRSTAKMHEFRVAQADFIEGRDPTPLFSLAVGILGDVAATIARLPVGPAEALAAPEVRPAAWDHDLPVAEALRFVSNFFDAFLNAKLDEELTAEFSLLCACAYYLGGNVGSAVVIVRQIDLPELDLAGGLGRMVHRILRGDYSPIEGAYDLRASVAPILGALDRFFALEDDAAELVERTLELRAVGYASGNPRLLLYADLVAALCRRKIDNASRTLLPPASDLPLEAWRPALKRPAFPTELWPAQQRIAEAGLLQGRSAVIQMPTSAGKTRATELIIRAAFLSGRANLAVIVAPYRSLCHDIRGDLAAAFADDAIAIDEASDAFQFDLELEQLIARDTVLIVTPEKLLYMLRRAPELADTIGLIIYDEGHQFDGMARGPTYELLLTSLRMKLKPGTQSVLISAVIGNAADIAGWLIGDRDAVIGGAGLLPTAKSIAFASWQDARGRLEYVSPTDPDEREYFVPRIITTTPLARRGRERTARVFPEKDSGDIGLFLGLHLVGNGSVAIFCGRKDSVTRLSRRMIEIYDRGLGVPLPIAVSNPDEVGKLAFLASLHLGETPATQATRMGVLSHHAATPHGLRLAVEHAMKRGHARFVVCTSTLAQGVNFPIRYLVITTTQQGAESIMVRDFHNLMGRAGRAGMHTEGSVIFSSPAIFDERGPQKNGWKWEAAKHLLDAGNSEPSLSGLLKLFHPFEQRGAPPVVQPMLAQWLDLAFANQDRIDEIVVEAMNIQPLISAAQFRLFIEDRAHAIQQIAAFLLANMNFEDPAADDRVQELATHTLGYFLADDPTRTALIQTFRTIAASIKARADDNLQGIIRRSPLPPSVAAELQAWVAANLDTMNEANLDGTLLEVVGAAVLPYASDRSIRSMSDRTCLPRLLAAWADGRSYAQLLQIMEENGALRISNRKPTVEDAVSLGDGGFGYDVAMLVAAITDMVEPVDGNLHAALSYLQKRVKYGLALPSAIAMHEAGFADRVVATTLGTIWPLAFDRDGVRAACRAPNGGMAAALRAYPEYFSAVAEELRR